MPNPGSINLGSATDYTPAQKFAWAAAFNDIDPTLGISGTEWEDNFLGSMGPMVMSEKLIAASSDMGGNPYQFVEAYDPDADLANFQDRHDELDALVDALADADVSSAISLARTYYDTSIHSSADIDTYIAAMEAASKGRHLREVARVHAGAFAIRAVQNSQLQISVGFLSSERENGIALEDSRLRLYNSRERAETVLRIADQLLRHKLAKIQATEGAFRAQFDIGRFRIAAKQDQLGFNLEMETKDALYDLELFAYYGNALASINGAAVLPRAQTTNERIAGAFLTSTSFGLQTGVAMGSPQAGIAGGLVSLASQLYGI